MSLSDDERARIEEEEILRARLRQGPDKPEPKGFWRAMMAPDNVKWIIASLMVPLATAVWGTFDAFQHRAERKQQVELAEARKDVDQMTALIPNLSSEKPTERAIGIAVLASLVNTNKAAPALKAAYAQIQAAVVAGQVSERPTPGVDDSTGDQR